MKLKEKNLKRHKTNVFSLGARQEDLGEEEITARVSQRVVCGGGAGEEKGTRKKKEGLRRGLTRKRVSIPFLTLSGCERPERGRNSTFLIPWLRWTMWATVQ